MVRPPLDFAVAHRRARECDAVTAMNEPIEDGIREGRFAEIGVPLVDRCNVPIGPGGRLAERARRTASSCRCRFAGQEQPVAAPDPVTRGEGGDEALVEAALGAVVDVLDRGLRVLQALGPQARRPDGLLHVTQEIAARLYARSHSPEWGTVGRWRARNHDPRWRQSSGVPRPGRDSQRNQRDGRGVVRVLPPPNVLLAFL